MKGSRDGDVIDAIQPLGDEVRLPKSSASVFMSTHIDYILRNMGVTHLIMVSREGSGVEEVIFTGSSGRDGIYDFLG